MTWLGEKQDTYFFGQAVGYPGTGMTNTLKGVPESKKLELPVAEETQMGMTTGLALAGFVPVSIYPRLNFLLCAMSGLVNHLDKYPILSDGGFMTKAIIRVGIGSVIPLDPQYQHKGDFTEAIQAMCKTVTVVRLEEPEQIFQEYVSAYNRPTSTILVEVSDFLNEDYRKDYSKFRETYRGA
jgi:pyruvate/2-oxoglutarate/acetoin dehydrogenase E1 component